MRSPLRSLATGAIAAILTVTGARAGGIPSPFGEPETSRPVPTKKPAAEAGSDDVLAPPAGRPLPAASTGAIERTTLPPLEAQPAPAAEPATEPATEPAWPRSPADGAGPPEPDPSRPNPNSTVAPPGERSRTVMRDELTPVMAADGSGLPYELWRGLTVESIEQLFAAIEIPPRSPVLHGLFRRLITSDVPPPTGGASDPRFTALRVEALDRSGLIDEAAALLARESTASDPVLALLSARTAIARGDRDGGCRTVQALNSQNAPAPDQLKIQAILIRAYCSAAAGNRESAELQVALARDAGVVDSAGLDAIDAIASGGKPTVAQGRTVGPVDWRILELAGPVDAGMIVATASPGLLAVIARDTTADPALRLAAAEAAARHNGLAPGDLAAAYRTFAGGDATTDGTAAAVRHAALFQSADDERTPLKKARLIRSFLDEARRDGFYWAALQVIGPAAAAVPRVPEIGWFTETAIEAALASGDFDGARSWARFGDTLDGPGDGNRDGYIHWLALADIADPALSEGRARHLAALEEIAARGRFTPDHLHRLATVLDALQIQVPIPLWDLASRTPQPATGHLPKTGVLSALAEAAKKKEFGHTVLLSMQALGPSGAEGAHIISLGDSIRALRSAGLDTDAHKLALEALFMGWPRSAGL
jgi:hypothetical protein